MIFKLFNKITKSIVFGRQHLYKCLNLNSTKILKIRKFSSSIYETLEYSEIKYNCVKIDMTNKNSCQIESSDFAVKLYSTITSIKSKKKSAIFLKFSSLLGHFIPIAANYGFKFHNAEGESATMLLWLLDSENKVPPYATHHIGVGAAVLKGSS